MRNAAFVGGAAAVLVVIAAVAGCAAKPGGINVVPQPAAVAAKPHAEVLLLGRQPGDLEHPWQQITDILVEYGVYIESDEQDNLPTALPDNLDGYKVIVLDRHWAGLKDPVIRQRLARFDPSGRRVIYQDPPVDIIPLNDNILQLFWGDEEGSRTKLAGDLSQYKVILADSNLACLQSPAIKEKLAQYKKNGGTVVCLNTLQDVKWYRERQIWMLMDEILKGHDVTYPNPAFLARNAARPDKEVILQQAEWNITHKADWLKFGGDVDFMRTEATWTAADLYGRDDIKKGLMQILDEEYASSGGESGVFAGVLLPMYKQIGNAKYLNACADNVRSLASWQTRAARWTKDGPYFRCEEISGLIDAAQMAGVMGKKEYLAPAIAIMKVGHDTLFDEKTHVWAHAGIRGRWKGVPWGRGQGWLLFGLVSLLENMPKDHPDYPLLQTWLEQTAEGLERCQDPETGLWRNIVTDPTSRLEVSGTTMIVRHLCHAWRCGALRSPAVRDMLTRAWVGLKAHTFQNRTCTQAYSSDAGFGYMYYHSLPQLGVESLSAHAGAEYVKTFGEVVPEPAKR